VIFDAFSLPSTSRLKQRRRHQYDNQYDKLESLSQEESEVNERLEELSEEMEELQIRLDAIRRKKMKIMNARKTEQQTEEDKTIDLTEQ
jgi:predicted nuclease with TOPRIM domain